MKPIKNQYIDLKEGRMTEAQFMRNVRMSLPQYISNGTLFIFFKIRDFWYPKRDSNPHSLEADFESAVSTNSTIRASILLYQILNEHGVCGQRSSKHVLY